MANRMTIPNIITLIRLFLIPAFVLCVVYYVTDFKEGGSNEKLRWGAAIIFIVAAISDGVDGFIARRFNQRSELGAVLDPLADKLLQVTALLLLSWDFHGAFHRVPLWLPILVISRDLFISFGYIILKLVVVKKVELRPHWSGKAATALTMVLITLVLLKWTHPPFFDVILYSSGVCVLISLVVYTIRGVVQMNQATVGSEPKRIL